MAKVILILVGNIIANVTVEDKNTFIELLTQDFSGKSCDIITDEKLSAKLFSLT